MHRLGINRKETLGATGWPRRPENGRLNSVSAFIWGGVNASLLPSLSTWSMVTGIIGVKVKHLVRCIVWRWTICSEMYWSEGVRCMGVKVSYMQWEVWDVLVWRWTACSEMFGVKVWDVSVWRWTTCSEMYWCEVWGVLVWRWTTCSEMYQCEGEVRTVRCIGVKMNYV